MASTAAAIRDRVRTLIEALLPTQLSADKLRSSRNEAGADFQDWAEKNPTSALRRFQARDDGEEDPPEVSNTDIDLRHFSIVVLVAYPQNARYGADQAMDRDDAMDTDWGLINRAIGIYGRANFSGSYDCTPLGAVKTRIRGAGVDFLEIRARFSYYRQVQDLAADLGLTFFEAGQSNALGLALVSGLSDSSFADPYPSVIQDQKSASAADDPIVLDDYGPLSLAPWGAGTTMGPELSFGRDLDAALTETVSIAKFAVNNSSIGDGTAGSNWYPTAVYPSTGDNLFELAMTHVEAVLSEQGSTFAGTLWCQGERDADTVFAPDYCANLTAFYVALCARLGTKPFIFTRLHPDSDAADTAITRDQQLLFSAITPYVAMINTDDLVLFDTRHFDADSQVTIGQRASAAYVAMQTLCTLSASIVESADPVTSGASMSYAVVITAATAAAVNVGVEVVLPSGAAFVSGSGTGWTVSSIDSRVIATRSTLSVGASPTLTINVTATNTPGTSVATVNAVASNCTTIATDTESTTIEAGASWSTDATSGLPRPINGTEWSALLTSLSAGSSPTHAYLCQEASGVLDDSIGTADLSSTGTVSYANDITGQTANAVGFGGTAGDRFSSGSGPAPASVSCSMVAVIQLDSAPATESALFGLATGLYVTHFTNGVVRAFVGAGGGGNNLTSHTGLCVIAIDHNRAGSADTLYSHLEKATLTYDGGGVGTLRMGLGGVDGLGFTTHAGAKVLLAAVFEDVKTSTQWKAIIGALSGTTPPWSP